MTIKRIVSFLMIETIRIFNLDNTYEKTIKYNDVILKFNPEFEYSWQRKALAFKHLGNYKEAIHCYDEIIRLKPTILAKAIRYKGDILRDLGKYDDALNCFNQCLRIDPKNCEAMLSKAICYSDLGDYCKAINILDFILEVYPDSTTVLYNKAVFLIEKGNREESFDLFDLVINADIDIGDPFVNRLSKKNLLIF